MTPVTKLKSVNRAQTLFSAVSLVIPLIGAIILSIESYLTRQGISFCKTTACEIVGRYLTISEAWLITFGASFFWLLAASIFFARRYPVQVSKLPFALLFGALAFDGTLLGFQFYSIEQRCLICITVAIFLLLTAITYSLSQHAYLLILAFILTWGGGFVANSIMIMPEQTGAYQSMIFHQQPENDTSSPSPPMTLVFSMSCPHCFNVISHLAETDQKNRRWQFASIDQDHESLQKIQHFINNIKPDSNPFILLKEIKTSQLKVPEEISDQLKHATMKARIYLGNVGITNIPLIIVQPSGSEKRLIMGDKNIIGFLNSQENDSNDEA